MRNADWFKRIAYVLLCVYNKTDVTFPIRRYEATLVSMCLLLYVYIDVFDNVSAY